MTTDDSHNGEVNNSDKLVNKSNVSEESNVVDKSNATNKSNVVTEDTAMVVYLKKGTSLLAAPLAWPCPQGTLSAVKPLLLHPREQTRNQRDPPS